MTTGAGSRGHPLSSPDPRGDRTDAHGTPYGATKRPRLVWLLAGRPLMARVASPTRRRGVVA